MLTYDNRKWKSYSVTILLFNLFLFAGDKKIPILRKKQNRFSSISLSDIKLTFIYLQKTSTSSVCFGETKGFMLLTFAWKQKYQVTKLARRAKLSRVFNVVLNLRKHQGKIYKLSWQTINVRNFWTLNIAKEKNPSRIVRNWTEQASVLMRLLCQSYELHSALFEIVSLVHLHHYRRGIAWV